jgi:hypothetical protein
MQQAGGLWEALKRWRGMIAASRGRNSMRG